MYWEECKLASSWNILFKFWITLATVPSRWYCCVIVYSTINNLCSYLCYFVYPLPFSGIGAFKIGLPTFGKWHLGRQDRDAVGVERGGEWGGYPLRSRLGGLGEHRELLQRGPKTNFWHIKHRRTPAVEGKLGVLWDIYICLFDHCWTLTGKIAGRRKNVKTARSFSGQ